MLKELLFSARHILVIVIAARTIIKKENVFLWTQASVLAAMLAEQVKSIIPFSVDTRTSHFLGRNGH